MTPHHFDGRVALYHGDSTVLLGNLASDICDAVITDPPYELGFMGKSWDDSGIAYNVDLWRECLRILKPGGHLLAFGGTRTYHRLACAIEDAGFEIRDSITWIYGCLSADTEILTEHGWRPGIDVQAGDRVAQWDARSGEISLTAVEETFRAPWDGPMRVLRNADTDQLLTPNHRVYHQPSQRRLENGHRRRWYNDQWQVAEAGALSTWNPIRLPVAGEHEGPGVGGDDYAALLGWVWTEGGFDLSGTGVRIYQSSVNAEKVAEIAALLDRLGAHKRYDQSRTYTRRNGAAHPHVATTWFFSGDLARRVRADLPGKRPTYDLLWRMTGAEKRALLRAAMLGDGSGWATHSQQFYQQYEDDLIWLQTLLALIGRSGKVGMRPNRPGGTLYLRDRATTELQARHLVDSQQDYAGEVWCVRVPTGAFIARRNGKIFITGNSGFPKGLDVSKAIDKASGAQREVIGARRYADGTAGHWTPADTYAQDEWSTTARGKTETAPATDAARRWEGWNVALKPASEPIVVARKPLVGTVVANVLAHGTGALNIDATRVHGECRPLVVSNRRSGNDVYGDGLQGSVAAGTTDAGRWPTNVLLDEYAAAELDAQSGTLTSGANPTRRGSDKFRDTYGEFAGQDDLVARKTDAGGASRFFPVFRYQAKASTKERPKVDGVAHATVKPLELMRWLVRLVTPPDGVVLEPFAGSGTTVEACLAEGFRCIAIEREATYLPLILERVARQAVRS